MARVGEHVLAPLEGTVVTVAARPGDVVRAGEPLLVIESMKMEHEVCAPGDGVVDGVHVAPGEGVEQGRPLVTLRPAEAPAAPTVAATGGSDAGASEIRPELAEVHRRHAAGLDEHRPEAVARRRARGQRTARENVEDLCDPGTFVEYGALAVAAQRGRRSLDELIERTPADGLVAGVGEVDGRQCAVLAYDYTVLAGTQGAYNHLKKDRLFELAAARRLPVVLFAEGGGGRPGDTDVPTVAALDVPAFHLFARLSGLVPLVGVVSGRCFAGNAALLGCCDVVIATDGASIGMGGPAMIEGGGLGRFEADEVGPLSVQVPNGVVDVTVADEAEAVATVKRYLSYFAGPRDGWTCADQRRLREAVPGNRVRAYEMGTVLDTLADTGSVLELRPEFGRAVHTALARVEGRPLGVIASNPGRLGGAIDSDAADKAARFMQLCDAHGLPIVSLCDTPGFLVGPAAERTATVRHVSRLFVVGANLTVPLCMIILRKAYGLGAMAMAGGSLKVPQATVAWPTGELGAMGLEGAVRLGFRRELAAAPDPDRLFDELVWQAYEHGKALNAASMFELDDVIDPADTRRWIAATLGAAVPPPPPAAKRRPHIDTW